jgi:anti-sigma factor ChrR (cupin superfamily)
MSYSELFWQPQTINTNLLIRSVELSTKQNWYQTNSTGIWFCCFESDLEIQEHPVTMLTRFDPGGFFEHHNHVGGEEILVLRGTFRDERGTHPPGTYMLNSEGFEHQPYSDEGCLTFVKLQQYGGKNRSDVKTNIYDSPWQPSLLPQVRIKSLYQQPAYPERIWIESWRSGTQLSNLVEAEVKEILVIKGTLQDESMVYPADSWLRYPPGHHYNLASETGCLLYVKTYPASNSIRFTRFSSDNCCIKHCELPSRP